VVSPLSTGGAGTIFEYRVAAVVLAALLRGDRVPGLEVPVTEVRLQQRIADHYLDDVIAIADHPGEAPLQVDFQVKRSLNPVPSDEEWQSVVEQCLDTLEANRDRVVARHHLFGLAARGHAGHLEELKELTRWASRHPGLSSFLTVIEAEKGGPRAAVVTRWGYLRDIVRDQLQARPGGAPSQADIEEAAYRIAAALCVWVVEPEDGEDDHRNALDRLGDLLPQDQPDAADKAFLALANIAEARAPRAGGITAAGLRAEMARKQVPLTADPRQRTALAALDAWTTAFLAGTRDRMDGKLHLPRTTLLDQVVEAAAEHRHVLVTGRAGSGKSALARLAAQQLRDNGATVLALSLAERQWSTLSDVEHELKARIDMALAGARTTGSRVVLIDGAEQALTDDGALLASLLQAVPHGEDALTWHVLLTTRDEAATEVTRALTRQSPNTVPFPVTVGDLTDPEVAEILDAFSQLRPLGRHARPQRLLRRPYLVDLLVRGSAQLGLPENMLAEEDVAHLVYEGLIRRGGVTKPGLGAPDARSDIYLTMADSLLRGSPFSRLTGTDSQARSGLVSDNVLDRKTTNYRFSHDVLADYAVATALADADGPTAVADAPEPRRILRSVRLWMQTLLADATAEHAHPPLDTVWTSLHAVAETLAARDGERWRDLPYEALLNCGPVEDALRNLVRPLTANDGTGLARLMEVTLRHARLGHTPGAPTPTLDTALSAPLVGLLATLGERLPEALRASAAKVVCAHLRALPEPHTAEEVPHAELLPAALACWTRTCRSRHQPEDRDGIEALAILAEHLDPAAEDFLLDTARASANRIGQALEEQRAVQALARHRPRLLQRLALLYFLGQDPEAPSTSSPAPAPAHPRRGFSRRGQEGVHPHASRRQRAAIGIDDLAHQDRGPFAALLDHDPERGLDLIGRIVDAATTARIITEAEWQQRELTLDLHLAHWPQARTFRGTPTMWGWYRRQGTGAHTAMSALMALHAWAVDRRGSGAPLREVIDEVMGAGSSLALVAVAISVLVQDLDAVGDALDPFLIHPTVWALEQGLSAQPLGTLPPATPPNAPWHHTVMRLVLEGSDERREVLKGLGEQLVRRSDELVDLETRPLANLMGDRTPTGDPAEEARQQAERWAAHLNHARYQFQPVDDTRLQVHIDYPTNLTDSPAQERAARARASLDLTGLMYRAVRVRDEEHTEDPAHLHAELEQARDAHRAAGTHEAASHERDAVAAVAAAAILCADRGTAVPDAVLAWAADELRTTAHDAANIPRTMWDHPGQANLWGADRSAAMALPVLLVDAALRQRATTDEDSLANAITALATSPFSEVRVQLTQALERCWGQDCTTDPLPHETSLVVLDKMIATAGMGPWGPNGRPRVSLTAPLENAIADDDLRIDTELAAPAIPGLATAADTPCTHGQAAAVLLEAITAYDRTRWPAEYARKHYQDAEQWRTNLDQITAQRALEGDLAPLHAYMEAFAAIPEDLSGTLLAMGELATTPERTEACHHAWPQIFDALLPAHRTSQLIEGEPANSLDVQRLDEALLPLPPQGAPWPASETADLLWTWVRAYADRPLLVKRLVYVLIRNGWLGGPGATQAVLIVLGTHTAAIKQQAGTVVGWIRFVLIQHPAAIGPYRDAVQRLLDELAAAGSEAAMALQRELEA
jgi:energy-coupling factor transporter ATP-binding protein EcfA2